jgi:hypothetical protein
MISSIVALLRERSPQISDEIEKSQPLPLVPPWSVPMSAV